MSKKFWKGGNAGVEGSWTESLTSKTLTAAAAVNLGDNKVRIPCSHAGDFIENDYVVINGTSYYDGNHLVINISDATHFDIAQTFTAETFGGTETALSSNWQDEDGVPVAVPATDDDVVFDESAGIATDVSPLHIEDKRWNCISNIAKTDTGELDLGSLTVKSGYDGKIGIDAQNTISPLHISIADNGHITYQSDSEAYIECSADDAVTSINIPLLVFDSSAGFLLISSDVNDGTYKSEWDEIRCLNRGKLELAPNTVCQAIRTYDSNVTLVIGANCIDTSDSDDPIDLYIGDEDVYSTIIASNKVTTEGVVNFGAAALTLVKGR